MVIYNTYLNVQCPDKKYFISHIFCRKDESSVFELNTKALVAHTKRIFRFIHRKSNLSIEQFCFGSAYVQLNPVSQKLTRMDPSTWKKEGIADAWSGPRGLKRACCKNCCVEVDCEVKYSSIQFDGVYVKFLFQMCLISCIETEN